MAKPNRTLNQSKRPTKAQIQRDKKQQSLERTERMAQAQYLKAYRHAQVAIARQQAKQQAMADAGIQLQQQPQQKQPLTPAPKASGRKPPKPGKPAKRGQKPSAKKPPRR